MRCTWAVLTTAAATLIACTGSDKSAANAATTAGGATATGASVPSQGTAPPAAPTTPTATTAASPLPITGKTYEVKMVGDEKGYRFEPANLTIKVGDGLKFVNVGQGPHNVSFSDVPASSHAQLDANMPGRTGSGPSPKLADLSGPLLMVPNDTYTVSFAGVKPGVYSFNCTPHLALGMTGQVTVQ